MYRKYTLIFALISIFSIGSTQNIVAVCGEYTYYASENVSVEQAKKIALERAKIDALAKKFGTIISQINTTVIKSKNEKSETSFSSFGESEVKGEWIENTKDPEYAITYEKEMLVVKVKVCGKAKEIKKATLDITAKILRNDIQPASESDRFSNNDNIYLLFQSPAKGYLAVYLIDENPTAYCLLPYAESLTGQIDIKANKEYLFFSDKDMYKPQDMAKMKVFTDRQVEFNDLYIIFSKNPFTKALDKESTTRANGDLLPRKLSFTDFQQWLQKCRRQDQEMQVIKKTIEIRK